MHTKIARTAFSRRALLTGGLAGGFLLAFHLPLRAAVNEPVQPPDVTAGKFAPNAFIRIDATGATTLVMPQVEMGQGVYTSIAMILAEELDADWSKVALLARAAERQALRQPGLRPAGHRQLQLDPGLLEAAAQGRRQRARDAGAGRGRAMAGRARELHAPKGEVVHAASGRKLAYGALAAAASEPDAAQGRRRSRTPRISSNRQAAEAAGYAGQGQRQGRLRHRRDAAGHEVRDAGAVARCSAARSARSTTARRRKFPGVRKIVVLDDMVAVVGDHMWAAKKGLDALKIDWDEGPNAEDQSTSTSGSDLRAASEKDGVVAKSVGDIAKGLASGDKVRSDLRTAVPGARPDGADQLPRFTSSRTAARSGPAPRS